MYFNETVPVGVEPAFYYQSLQPAIIGVGVFYVTISAVAVALRFWARHLAGLGWWLDDWLALASVPFVAVVVACNMNMMWYGWGRHTVVLDNTDPGMTVGLLKDLFVMIFFYLIGISTFKCCALALYYRVFSVRPWLHSSCIGLGSLIVVWTVIALFVQAFRCSPIALQWAPSPSSAQGKFQGSSCVMDIVQMNIFMSVPNIIFGLLTLILPIRGVWQLNLPPLQRIGISCVFLLAGLDVVISIMRLVSVLDNNGMDKSYYGVIGYFWSVAEQVTGLLCTCLPSYTPIYKIFREKMDKVSSSRKTTLQGASDRYSKELSSIEGRHEPGGGPREHPETQVRYEFKPENSGSDAYSSVWTQREKEYKHRISGGRIC